MMQIVKLLDALTAHRKTNTEVPQFANVRAKILFGTLPNISLLLYYSPNIFSEYSKYDVGEVGTLEIQRGFLDIVWARFVPLSNDIICLQVDRYEEINITYEELDAWKTTLNSFVPPLVAMDSVDVHFVYSLWRLLKDRRYE